MQIYKLSVLRMGNYFCLPSKNNLIVATLNYSGILLNPFEFYSQQYMKDETQLSKIFEQYLKQRFSDYDRTTFKWGLGKIDQKMQRERYTPLYNPRAGIENGRLLSIKEFEIEWEKHFQKNARLIQNLEYKAEEKERTKIFDCLVYETILSYVYQTKNMERISSRPVNAYQEFMEKFFSKAFLDERKKIQITLRAMEKEKFDILFLQEANQRILESIKYFRQFQIITSGKGESIIIVRRNRFKKIHNQKQIMEHLGEGINKCLDWNNDTAIGFVDNLILFSGHLSSKKEKNPEQVKKMLESLGKIKKIYPESNIIVGCDANSFLKQVPSFLHVFPCSQDVSTVMKKRTMLQPQVNKADVVAEEVRDHLMTDLNMTKKRVFGVNGQFAQQIGYLPCDRHPYDHFLVAAQISLPE